MCCSSIMDFSARVHLIPKHTTMTNNEIMQANLLDIVFENRNKEYGAYALRKSYNNNLLMAVGAGMSVILLFILLTSMNKKNSMAAVNDDRQVMVIKEYVLPEEKKKEPVKPKEEVAKPKPKAPVQAAPKVAEVKFTTPEIKDVVKTPMPPADEMAGKTIADKKSEGVPDDGIVKTPAKPAEESGNGTNAGPSKPESEFVIQERDPEFPGGQEGLKKFLSRYLSTPDELEAGERKVVKVRFKVDKDGAVNTFEIVTSGGSEYDSEVVRVCKKMPKWIPAIQNGMNVPVSYVLPVTFIGLEE